MVDSGCFASMKKSYYESLVKLIQDRGMLCEFNKVSLVSDLIEHCGGVYYTDGLKSLKTIPDQSVDFIWSQAVLEHIRLYEFDETMHELRRVVRADGICSHRVDLKDHLGGSANNLRFGRHIWESDWIASSGFYTNRLRFMEMMAKFKGAGFDIHVINKVKWQDVPISKKKLALEFREMTNANLLISGFDVILKPSD
ncbi:MAG: methyltransferase domain-containing protein [Candidatus Electrothrix sp. ATG2]|nr:methyltransferase domain-containing protein [Candidatus Electrothrix sp. ATG2]